MQLDIKAAGDKAKAAAEAIAAASLLIDRMKPLVAEWVGPDAIDAAHVFVADRAQDAAHGAARGMEKVKGGMDSAASAFAGVVQSAKDARSAAAAKKAINQARQSIFESAATVIPLDEFLAMQAGSASAGFNGFDMPGSFLVATYRKNDHDKKYVDYLGIYLGSCESLSGGVIRAASREGNVDVYADLKYRQNMVLFAYPCERADLAERHEMLASAFDDSRLYGADMLV